jgi:hypothetical protein
MFGKKRMSATDRFVVNAGRANGNLSVVKKVMPPSDSKNRKTAGTPFNKKKPLATVGKSPTRGQGGAKSAQQVSQPNKPTLGQVNTFKTSGTLSK